LELLHPSPLKANGQAMVVDCQQATARLVAHVQPRW
jgi:hypothetical protein